MLLVLGPGTEGTDPEKKEGPEEETARGGEQLREGKTRDVYERQDRRCRWSVAGIERYVVEGEVMEEGGNRWECLQGDEDLGRGRKRLEASEPIQRLVRQRLFLGKQVQGNLQETLWHWTGPRVRLQGMEER